MVDPLLVNQTSSFLGESAGFWFQTSVFIISAFIAVWTLWKNEKQARRRATIDLVLMETQDSRTRDFKEKFGKLRESGENLTKFACEPLVNNPDQNEVILAILNHYEFIASGVFEGALDEGIYKRMKKTLVIRDWKTLEPYVMELRRKENRPAIYIETQKLAEKWEKEMTKKK